MERSNWLKRFINCAARWLDEGSDALDEEMRADLNPETPSDAPEASVPAPDKPKRARESLRARLIRLKLYRTAYALAAVALCAAFIAALMLTVMDMPYFGAADTLVDSEVSGFYLENAKRDTGAVNVISAIILNYRGFDTLGEAHVLFIAVCSVIILMRAHPAERAPLPAYDYDDAADEPHDDDILITAAKYLAPMILLFGLYIILNGNLSPGGGFSGGAVIGAGLILYLSAFGYERARRFINDRVFKWATCVSLLSYAALKGWHFITGANGLETHLPKGEFGSIFSGGLLLPLNICVGLVVALTMYALFTMFRKGDF